MEEPETTDPIVAALLRERDAYRQRELPDRVAQVEEQLRIRGWRDASADRPTAEPELATEVPKGRRAPQRRTTG